MNKNLWGFALFALIFGATVLIFNSFEVVNTDVVSTPLDYSNYAGTTSCWRMKRQSVERNFGSLLIKQAMLNLDSKQLKWELDTAQTETPIALNFFIGNEKGIRYLNSSLVPTSAFGNGLIEARSSFGWLNKLKYDDNLYVIAQPLTVEDVKNKNYSTNFESEGTSVLIY
ncbi:MAG: hypothetical protein ABIP06_13415 [Pyrinomonadaceae bacterium]